MFFELEISIIVLFILTGDMKRVMLFIGVLLGASYLLAFPVFECLS
jgi:hypothetical protein